MTHDLTPEEAGALAADQAIAAGDIPPQEALDQAAAAITAARQKQADDDAGAAA